MLTDMNWTFQIISLLPTEGKLLEYVALWNKRYVPYTFPFWKQVDIPQMFCSWSQDPGSLSPVLWKHEWTIANIVFQEQKWGVVTYDPSGNMNHTLQWFPFVRKKMKLDMYPIWKQNPIPGLLSLFKGILFIRMGSCNNVYEIKTR